jgi:SAM-dependent methyltransferase
MTGVLLDVGCGWSPYRSVVTGPGSPVASYLGLDLEGGTYASEPELKWDGTRIPLGPASVESAMATEVLEHCPDPDIVLSEIWRVLKPNGILFITVPFLWPLHDVPYDEYRYTPFSLSRHLRRAGFESIEITALGGWSAALATMIGLWVQRSPMAVMRRRILQVLLFPLYRRLIRWDVAPVNFEKPCMITGLTAIAIKVEPGVREIAQP